jgi:DoxX-like family
MFFSQRKLRAIYWIVTPLFLILQGWAAMQELTEAPRMAATITGLGYPIYFMKMLGVAKVLGILAIASGVSRPLKEWAYAGFTFDVCAAIVSHLSIGDSALVALVPLGVLVLQLSSYFAWKRISQRRAFSKRHYGFGLPRERVASHA